MRQKEFFANNTGLRGFEVTLGRERTVGVTEEGKGKELRKGAGSTGWGG